MNTQPFSQTDLCSEIETKINTSSMKGSSEDEIGRMFLKTDSYDLF